MMRRALLVGLLLLGGAARAQDVPDALLPPEPALAPPAPAALAPTGAPMVPPPPPSPQGNLPAGMTLRPDGVVRFTLAGDTIAPALAEFLHAMGARLGALPYGRIAVEVQVSGPANDASLARRASLARAQAVKAMLVAGGLDATRIDLRPLGRLSAGVDTVDVLPPGVASPNTEARSGR
jgi:outer membrane protein OmpA-like peptidoglycan-associated protein